MIRKRLWLRRTEVPTVPTLNPKPMHRVTSLCLPRRTLISHCGTESSKVRGHCQMKRNIVSLCQQTPSPACPFLGHTVISYSKLFHSWTQHSQSAQMRCRFMQTHGWIRIMTSGYIPFNILFGREPLRLRIWPSRLCFAFPLVGHFAEQVVPCKTSSRGQSGIGFF